MSMDIHPLYERIGRAIRYEREAIGFSQADLAVAIGLTRTSLTNIESGRQRLPIHLLYQIASELAVSPYVLLPEKGAYLYEEIPTPTLGGKEKEHLCVSQQP